MDKSQESSKNAQAFQKTQTASSLAHRNPNVLKYRQYRNQSAYANTQINFPIKIEIPNTISQPENLNETMRKAN